MREYNDKDLYPNKKTLSSTQFLLYEKDVRGFYLSYVMGVKKETSSAMCLGRIFSEMYADRKWDPTPDLAKIKTSNRVIDWLKEAVRRFPELPKKNCEYPLVCNFMGWRLRATLDGFPPSKSMIIENKTGAMEWTQDRADRSDQITFQAWVYWKKFGIPPKNILLNWVDTGTRQRLLSFPTERSVEALTYFESRVVKVIENINAKNFTKQLYE